MFFKLLPEVYLIVGKKKSLLQNVSNGRIFWIDNTISQFIKLCENNNPISNEFLECATSLEENGWGKITEKPIFSEKLRLVNIADKRQMHAKAPNIKYAVIKLTDRCNLECDLCRKIFCPSCFKEKSSKDISFKLFENIINKLQTYRCKTILLTGGEIALVSNLNEFYDLLKKMDFNVILNTNGTKKLDDSFINANILISVFSKEHLIKVLDNYSEFKNITILKYFNHDLQNILFPNVWKVLDRSSKEHKITKASLLNTSVDRFHIRQNLNSCLDGKIVVTQSGDVYPCLESMKSIEKVGNVNNEAWEDIIQKLEKTFWKNKVDDYAICKDCEFRYVCDSCMFDNIKENCCYNMELGLWK